MIEAGRHGPRWFTALTVSALCAGVLGACHVTLGPEATLETYLARLRDGKIEAAYALTTSRYRARHDLASFAAAVARQASFAARAGVSEVESVVELGDEGAEPVVAIGHGRRFRLAADPLDLYPNDTPEHALRSFARAVRLDRRAQLDRLVAPSLKGQLSPRAADPLGEELGEAARAIAERMAPRSGLPTGVLQLGAGHARLLLGDGRAIRLDLGADGWQLSVIE